MQVPPAVEAVQEQAHAFRRVRLPRQGQSTPVPAWQGVARPRSVVARQIAQGLYLLLLLGEVNKASVRARRYVDKAVLLQTMTIAMSLDILGRSNRGTGR